MDLCSGPVLPKNYKAAIESAFKDCLAPRPFPTITRRRYAEDQPNQFFVETCQNRFMWRFYLSPRGDR